VKNWIKHLSVSQPMRACPVLGKKRETSEQFSRLKFEIKTIEVSMK
jgi:hypothetical protein